jgi:N-methylhydantoinase A
MGTRGAPSRPRNRLAVDIGGTFTDLVLATDTATRSLKVLTTKANPEEAVIAGVAAILADAGLDPAALDLVIHGTTLATNALIERKGARTALITTEGFRDSIEIAYEHRFEQYDLYMERPAPLVPRRLRLEVPERVAADGEVLLALDEAALRALIPVLRTERIEAVAVSLLHAYRNPLHEQRIRTLLAEAMPDLPVTLSSEVCPEIREYERTSTTVANAYVLPLMDSYLARMQAGLGALGVTCPLLLMMSSGGITTLETARRFPIRLVESGPAGGVILARQVAQAIGCTRAIAFDMGGTTAKLTLIDDYAPQQSRHFEIARAYRFARGSGLPVRIPVIDMVEIGAGGGSIARVDALGRILVGPDSAGSEPGPACYGRGGDSPTVTDADLTLGRIDPRGFAGGRIELDPRAAADVIEMTIGAQLGMEARRAAHGIAEIVDETMASAARVHAVENGKETAGRTLIAFGGAAPLHAARLAQKLGIDRVVIPLDAGVGSAHGFLGAPIAYEVVRTKLFSLDDPTLADVAAIFADMRAEAEAVVRLGAPQAELHETRVAFMRYRGQGHEIAVPLPDGGTLDPVALRKAFEATYTQLYGRIIPKLEIEALTWMLTLTEYTVAALHAGSGATAGEAHMSSTRRMIDPGTGEEMEAAVLDRAALPHGAVLAGPAAIIETGTTTIVPAGFTASPGPAGVLLLERNGA